MPHSVTGQTMPDVTSLCVRPHDVSAASFMSGWGDMESSEAAVVCTVLVEGVRDQEG